jgi:hypothetical protein
MGSSEQHEDNEVREIRRENGMGSSGTGEGAMNAFVQKTHNNFL